MPEPDKIPRLSRLTAILLKLQASAYVSVEGLARQFQVSSRTIYRDMAALEEAGVPLVSEEGRGFSLLDGYNIPPVMFTQAEANALIIAEKMVEKTEDASLITEFNRAIDKIRSVLRDSDKQKADFLARRTIIGKNWQLERSSAYLSEIQQALTNLNPVDISYRKQGATSPTRRIVEPFAIYHNTSDHWVLIAWCRLRNDFRNFRLDRMVALQRLDEQFEPHQLSLEEYVEIQRQKHFQNPLT